MQKGEDYIQRGDELISLDGAPGVLALQRSLLKLERCRLCWLIGDDGLACSQATKGGKRAISFRTCGELNAYSGLQLVCSVELGLLSRQKVRLVFLRLDQAADVF